jgi:hypothetical protein
MLPLRRGELHSSGSNQRADRADHRKNAGNIALIEGMHGNAGAYQLGGDRRLEVGEGKHEVGFEGENLGDVS